MDPCKEFPFACKKQGRTGKVVIVNLQKTKKDSKADLVIHAKSDQVMQLLCTELGIDVVAFERSGSRANGTVKRELAADPPDSQEIHAASAKKRRT